MPLSRRVRGDMGGKSPQRLDDAIGLDGFRPGSDGCIQLFAFASARFARQIPHGGRVLEIGCAEADWLTPMKAARPDLHLTGIDVRKAKRAGADEIVLGDALTHEFPEASFDAIVFVSALEHVGLGHYGDPVSPDGDTEVMRRCRRWIKPTGWVYADVPYLPDEYTVCGTSHRIYDDAAIAERLTGTAFRLVWETWWSNVAEEVRPTPDMTRPYPGFYYAMLLWEPI